MNRRMIVFAVLVGTLGVSLLAACVGNDPIGTETTPSPIPATPPDIALFTANVEPFMESGATPCGNVSCHDATTGSHDSGAPYVIVTGDSAGNFSATSCNPRTTKYGPSPQGSFLAKFCTGSGSPVGGGHSGHVATAQNCTDFYNWLKSGSGTPPTCP